MQDAYHRINRIGAAMLPDCAAPGFQVPLCFEITPLNVPGTGTKEDIEVGIRAAFAAREKVNGEFGSFVAARAKKIRVTPTHEASEGVILATQAHGNAADHDGYADQ